MKFKLLITTALALAFGVTSYIAGDHYLHQELSQQMVSAETSAPIIEPMELAKVVVADGEFTFGEEIDPSRLKVVDWPQNAFPQGGFSSIQEITAASRRAMGPIRFGQPILTSMLSPEDEGAGLSSLIAEGNRAVTIPVDSVNGVGGFVQPGDRVDLLLIRQNAERTDATSSIILQNVKVLSIDQQINQAEQIANVANTVTLEATPIYAQKIAHALSVGTLSLLLRSKGDVAEIEKPENKEIITGSVNSKPTKREIKVTSGNVTRKITVKIDSKSK